MHPQAEDCQGPPGAGKNKEGSSSRAFGGSAALQTMIFDFWPPQLGQNSLLVVLGHPVGVLVLG